MSIEEFSRWKHHFEKNAFTWDLIDFAQAHICQCIAKSLGGKGISLEKFLLLKRPRENRT